jgi:hypothetical protein
MVELRKKGWNTVRARTLSEALDGFKLLQRKILPAFNDLRFPFGNPNR